MAFEIEEKQIKRLTVDFCYETARAPQVLNAGVQLA